MNTLGIAPLPEGVCMVCQKKPATHRYTFDPVRGYGSCFDRHIGTLECCDDCDRKRFATWFGEKPVMGEWGETYRHEAALARFLEQLPVNSQEKFWNHSPNDFQMDAQDWIDLHLGELSDEKKREYGFDDELFDTAYEI